jgi:hypothetical protein
MDVVIIAAAITFMFLAAGFGLVFARLISRDRGASLPDDPETLFSPTRYRAMQRLLEEVDQKFIASHSFYTPQIGRKLRKTRIRIFRGYMQLLSDDFNRICKAIKLLMVSSELDRSELTGLVLRQQFRFSIGMMHVEFKLILYGFGCRGVDVSGLVRYLDAMRVQLQSLVSVVEPAGS